ncbi:MAG TPA: sulfur oxidation c-type cytochrome SoxA [Burkholderiales bacterium]|nr:sulfur oxidation c-type cytochrome SoxA [Burkholderiales bacterium]
MRVVLAAVAFLLLSAEIPLAERRSGYEFMGRETRAMQDDDATNPALLWLLDGEALWKSQGCSGCHADMKGVAARYPKAGVSLEQQINHSLKTKPFPYESRELLALTAYVAKQSRGMPIEMEWNETNRPFLEAGRAFFNRRQGQLNLACAQCHDDNWGKQLSGSTIPQAHPTGYPIYRLEWQGMGSLQRRFRNCLIGVRAEPYPYGAKELVELEMFLMWRARGMKLETPAVRP